MYKPEDGTRPTHKAHPISKTRTIEGQMFGVIRLDTQKWSKKQFQSGKDADDFAKLRTKLTGVKHQVRPILDENWREKQYAIQKANIPLGGFNYTFERRDHYAFITDDGQISFVRSEEDGKRNVRTVMNFGRYLQEFFPHLPKQEVQEKVELFLGQYGPMEVKWAITPDEIEDIFRRGAFSSCAHFPKWNSEKDGEHPARVYAAGDIHMAYIERDGKVTSRAICYPERKIFVQSYCKWGTDKRLNSWLLKQGYAMWSFVTKNTVTFNGAKLRKIVGPTKKIHGPHIDYFWRARDAGDHLIVDDKGDIEFSHTTGYAGGSYKVA